MRLFDSYSGREEELLPPPGPIGMYFCGPTVYQRIHIGNARPFVLSMWLRRWLALRGYQVRLVENVTDINDKIYDAARGLQIGSAELAERATRWYVEDTGELGLGRPDVEPLASHTIPEIVALIEALVARGLAYESQGDVYFRVARLSEYGRLSGARLEDMVAQEPGELKQDPRDFALWKARKPREDTWWDSPWGQGRPGWHIECSAMADKHLGPRFEIHGGGLDLRFPHHENERAQSLAAGREFARLWVHNGLLRLGAEKMSKSVGNIVSLREALDTWGREAILVFFLGAHYRSPIDYSAAVMAAARARADEFRQALRVAATRPASFVWQDFAAALDDDFDTPRALAILHDWRAAGQLDDLARGLGVFGLGIDRPQEDAPATVRRLAEDRLAARARRDFREADRIRDEIARLGWDVQDLPNGFRLIARTA
ncbi:MAG TPA: cysteine--tRNA ligase [Methylomirabilota bacterium]|jgi:cysteinyl-tRNA synthetase|nr:cysteine--tRNA ligase [Methylomirabilota bacterium]